MHIKIIRYFITLFILKFKNLVYKNKNIKI